MKRNAIDPAGKVCITTIPRLNSILKGEEDFDVENEEGSLFEADPSPVKEPLPVVYNAKFPMETFDFIVVDECHRSIYNIWRLGSRPARQVRSRRQTAAEKLASEIC